MGTRRRFTAAFKAKVAMEALRGDRTIQESAAWHNVPPNAGERLEAPSGRKFGHNVLRSGDGPARRSAPRSICGSPSPGSKWHPSIRYSIRQPCRPPSIQSRKRRRVSSSAPRQARWSAARPAPAGARPPVVVFARFPRPSSAARALPRVAPRGASRQMAAMTRCFEAGIRESAWRSPSRSARPVPARSAAAWSSRPLPISTAR